MTVLRRHGSSRAQAGGRAALFYALLVAPAISRTALAQEAGGDAATRLPEVQVNTTGPATAPPAAYAARPVYKPATVNLGPLGAQPIQDTPHSIDVIPEDLLVNEQVKTVNDALRYLPSVEVRDQQGLQVSRPQSRGFQGSVVQNTRLDGLNIIGTTAIPAENLSAIEVLNGPSGSLYGPETPAGVFDYITKAPTDVPIFRYVESFDSHNIFTEQIDSGGHTGPDNKFGYRVNLVHGQGESFVQDSYVNRSLFSGAFDYHFDNHTVVEINLSHYADDETGLPGSVVYDASASGTKGNTSSVIPNAIDPTRLGYGQPGAGTNLLTNTGLGKIKHEFDNGWTFEGGVLYQDAVRNLFGITNTLVNNAGAYTVTKNFTAVPHYTIVSNEASLNGHFTLFGFANEATLATNGYVQRSYSYRNSIAVNLPQGSPSNVAVGNLADPPVFASVNTPFNGGQYESGYLANQSIIGADTLHLTDRLAIQSVLNSSFLSSRSFAVAGNVTSADQRNGVLSPTESLIYKLTPKLTTYFTFADSIEQGDTAPTTGVTNPNVILAPYRDRLYEVGAKYSVFQDFLVTLAGFRMTRPYANQVTVAPGVTTFEVEGQQRNYGVELFGQGNITPEFSALGGFTYIDARLQNSGMATTNNGLIVGVPHWKSDVNLDYHPVFAHGAALTVTVHYESARAATDTNNSFANSFATLDLGARYSTPIYGHFATARFQVINVTNTAYFSSIADGNIVGSPGANTAYSGTPRVFQASLEVDF